MVLTKCKHLIVERLYHIYVAMFEHNLLYKPWKEFTTVVLQKPGKPCYDVPKAYRPIALLNTMWKILMVVVAEQLSHITKAHQLLPVNHFGGRLGHMTTDALHLLMHRIKSSWRTGKVTSVLFLDIEGAFPNAVPSKLINNLCKRGVPNKIMNFVNSMLRGWQTSLKSDGYLSNRFCMDNRIGQGDLLLMILYQYYNADLLDIPRKHGEEAIAYVDDAIMIATANTFSETHTKLDDMMTREEGVADWSKKFNSPLEYSKLALVDFAHRRKEVKREPLLLEQGIVPTSISTKYLGVVIDQNLDWNAQNAHALGKGTKWALQVRRIAKTTWGITSRYARRLYKSMAIPRMLYAADIWASNSIGEGVRQRGSAKLIKNLTTIQRMGALAITGGLRMSPMDTLDASAFLLPAVQHINNYLHKAAI